MNFMQNVMCMFKNYILNKFISLHLKKKLFFFQVLKFIQRKKYIPCPPLFSLSSQINCSIKRTLEAAFNNLTLSNFF